MCNSLKHGAKLCAIMNEKSEWETVNNPFTEQWAKIGVSGQKDK